MPALCYLTSIICTAAASLACRLRWYVCCSFSQMPWHILYRRSSPASSSDLVRAYCASTSCLAARKCPFSSMICCSRVYNEQLTLDHHFSMQYAIGTLIFCPLYRPAIMNEWKKYHRIIFQDAGRWSSENEYIHISHNCRLMLKMLRQVLTATTSDSPPRPSARWWHELFYSTQCPAHLH